MKKPLLLIDCSALAYAAFFSFGALSNDSQPTGVLYGFVAKTLLLAETFKTNDFVFCFDSKWTYREKDYAGYKEKRHLPSNHSDEEKAALESLFEQIQILRTSLLKEMGFENIFLIDGFEADDILAFWVSKMHGKRDIIMVTTDADMYQCLDQCSIYNPRSKKSFTEENLRETFGINACQWALAKAIGGCNSDGVSGIVGVSDPKSPSSKALKFLRGEMKDGKIYQKIISKEGQEIIKRNLPIVTVPYKAELMPKMILRRNRFSSMKFIKIFEKYNFQSFLKPEKLSKWKGLFC
jgi:5'-3' exonuclease